METSGVTSQASYNFDENLMSCDSTKFRNAKQQPVPAAANAESSSRGDRSADTLSERVIFSDIGYIAATMIAVVL